MDLGSDFDQDGLSRYPVAGILLAVLALEMALLHSAPNAWMM